MSEPTTFRQLVADMRHAQRMFYEHRNRAWLNEARRLERQVDRWLERHAAERVQQADWIQEEPRDAPTSS